VISSSKFMSVGVFSSNNTRVRPDMINKENVYRQIIQSGNLPTLPEILFKLLEACDRTEPPQSEIAAIISRDPALTYRVLQRVNPSSVACSSFAGIEAAVATLGIDSIKSIALTASVHQIFAQKECRQGQFKLHSFWLNSLLCATLARNIAKKTGFESLDEAYLSGLLHDIGRLVLVATFPKEHEWFLLETENIQNELWAETRLIGITHCDAGAWLIDTWKLNSLTADAVRFHHGPLERIRDAFPLVKIVYLANLLRENSQDHRRNCEEGELLLGLGAADLQEIADQAGDEVLRIAGSLNIFIDSTHFKGDISGKSSGQRDGLAVPAAKDIPAQLSLCEETDTGSSSEVQTVLADRVKSSTILSGILEDLVHASDSEAVISIFEQSMNILFNLTKVLFFLPDKEGRLRGCSSAASSLRHLSQGLILPVLKSSSLIVKAYCETQSLSLTAENTRDNLADGQVLRALRCGTVLLVPLAADKRPAGVVLLGIPDSVAPLSESDSRLIRMIAQQVGLCLYLEEVKLQKAGEAEADRMASLSMMARKFAHEINNPLGIVTNCLTTLGLKLARENEIQEELRIIGEEISRISSMVNNMDFFSNTSLTRLELTDVNAVIEDILHIVKIPLFTELGMEISFRPETALPYIVTSADSLKQIMLNLLKNASEAMVKGDMVEIRTGIFNQTAREGDRSQGGGIEITVEDTGPGLPESVMKSLYKPFVTTKKRGHSGLGLSIVYKAVKDLGGTVSCASIPDEGTRFSIYLPLEKNDLSE